MRCILISPYCCFRGHHSSWPIFLIPPVTIEIGIQGAARALVIGYNLPECTLNTLIHANRGKRPAIQLPPEEAYSSNWDASSFFDVSEIVKTVAQGVFNLHAPKWHASY